MIFICSFIQIWSIFIYNEISLKKCPQGKRKLTLFSAFFARRLTVAQAAALFKPASALQLNPVEIKAIGTHSLSDYYSNLLNNVLLSAFSAAGISAS